MLPDILQQLEARRIELRMPLAVVARRSGISLSTVYRVLKYRDESVSMAAVTAVADSLAARAVATPIQSADRVLRLQAAAKARRMASAMQGTAALEGQAVGKSVQKRAERMIIAKLLAGPAADLWG